MPTSAEIRDIAPLSGGAIQENWKLHCVFAGGREAGERRYVLRKDARSTIAASRSRLQEFALVRAAHAGGVTVPRPVAACADAGVLGAPFAIYEYGRRRRPRAEGGEGCRRSAATVPR